MVKNEQQFTALSYAVRTRVLLKYLGQLGLAVAALTLVPAAAAFWFGDYATGVRYLIVIALVLATAGPASRLPIPSRVQANEALAATALIFVLTPLLMTWPLMASGLGFIDALFEAVSGITTTGLSTVTALQSKPPALLFARAWMQWYGGLGIAVLSVSLLTGHHIAARRLLEPETATESIVTTTRTHARRVLMVYVLLTVAGLAVMSLTSVDTLTAVTHTFAALSTGGFSTRDASFAAFNGTGLPWVASGLSFLGAVSLPLYYFIYLRGWQSLRNDPELPALVLACLAICLALFLVFAHTMSWPQAARQAVLMGISAQTTTGFSSLSVQHVAPLAKVLMILSMMTGGCIGSTAGGIKLLRVLVAARVFSLAIRRTAMPAHAVVPNRLAGRPLDSDDIERTLLLIALFAAVVAASWVCFVGAGYPPLDALFEVVSATGTVGLSTGITSSALHPLLKGVLCFDMLAGRLEMIALLVLLYPGTWIGKKAEST